MIEVSLARIRELGKISAAFPDADLLPHLIGASLKVDRLLAGFAPSEENDVRRVEEAVACFAIANALPMLNTFYLANAKRVPRTVAETDYVFYDAHEIVKLVNMWKTRAAEALRDVNRTGGAVSISVI